MALRVFWWICRLGLGGLFVFAGITKLRNPFLFEMAVDAYGILPSWAVVIVARGLPWLEVVLGVLLLVGWQIKYFASAAALLLGAFVVMMGITYSHGTEANCGCFGFGEPIGPLTLTRDTLLFGAGVFLALYSWKLARKKSKDRRMEPATPLA